MKKIRILVDKYLVYAIHIDLLLVFLIWVLNSRFSWFDFIHNNKAQNLDLMSTIIGASISLSGFVLASLTIIVAIRSNVKYRSPEKAETPIELFFSIDTYSTIVKVFKIAIWELVICFISALIVWLVSQNTSNSTIFKFNVSFIYLMSMSTIRSLFVMFLLISIDTKSNQKEKN